MGRPVRPDLKPTIRQFLTLVTNNVEHFRRVPGLRLENWVH